MKVQKFSLSGERGSDESENHVQTEIAPARTTEETEPAGAVSVPANDGTVERTSSTPTFAQLDNDQQPAVLSTAERADLDRLVSRFRKLQRAWYEGLEILSAIRQRCLFRQDHPDFETFCRKVLGMGKSNVNRCIQTAEVAVRLATIVAKPEHESHIRPLLKLNDANQQVECYRQAREVASAEKRAVKASDVAKAVHAILSPEPAVPVTPGIKSQKAEVLARLQRSLVRGLEEREVTLLLAFEQDVARFREAWLAEHVSAGNEGSETETDDGAEHQKVGDDHE